MIDEHRIHLAILRRMRLMFWARSCMMVVDLVIGALLLWLAIFFWMHDAPFTSAVATATAFFHGRHFPDDLGVLAEMRGAIRKMKAAFR